MSGQSINCPHCKGSGQAPLSAKMQAVYDLVGVNTSTSTIRNALPKKLRGSISLTNQCLARLEKCGLVSSNKPKGTRDVYWSRVTA